MKHGIVDILNLTDKYFIQNMVIKKNYIIYIFVAILKIKKSYYVERRKTNIFT
jgi:hypothetical protein